MDSIQYMIKTILNDPQAVVLSMIVNVDGSSYRKEGAWMLLQENGNRIGVVSGGCLENDLSTRASQLFHTGKAEFVDYDLSAEDDLGWGRGVGCNGVVTVLVRDIDENFRQFLGIIYKQLLKKEPVRLLQSMTDFHDYTYMDQDVSSHVGVLLNRDIERPFHTKAGQFQIGEETFHSQLIWPEPALYILGAGVDARPLAVLAARVGYAVHLFDWRDGICNKHNFPTATSIQIGDIRKQITHVNFSPLDSVVIMTHDFQTDAAIVEHLLNLKLLYVGILGSKKRSSRLFGGEIPSEIHTPIGLSIGADGPDEIAISIVAELIAVRQGKNL
ncbi:XdhC family protein [Sporosarcina sp. BI001-red]|uniref:XdhC family protein n=1 Tax=Sporosarcina sp. BI001-red TaxID=2282866 RepID=UPI000E27F693|nr:XdhC family protein [Sporosarcina sp. BI001-red]REB06090.1 XdhC family protein [Sporosarcina sp. BI001-red]